MPDEPLHTGLGSTPVPDPTLLTTAAINAQIQALKELMTVRIDGLERAMEMFRADITRVPTDVDKQVGQLKELHEKWFAEQFRSIDQRFQERDIRGEREARDNKVAVDAAFAAQKEAAAKQDEANQKAIDKSEKATFETLGKQEALYKSTTDALSAQLVEAKERITRIESLAVGRVQEQVVKATGLRDSSGLVFGVVGALGVVSAIALALFR
jgi:hypothetical protein